MNIKKIIASLMAKSIGLRFDLPGGYVDFEFENDSNLKSIASSAIEAIDWQDLEYFYVLIKYNDKVVSLYNDKNRKIFVLALPEGDIVVPFRVKSFNLFEEAIKNL